MRPVHKASAAPPPAPGPTAFPDSSGPAQRSPFLLIPKGKDVQGRETKLKKTEMPHVPPQGGWTGSGWVALLPQGPDKSACSTLTVHSQGLPSPWQTRCREQRWA